jgi:hypothetical protein
VLAADIISSDVIAIAGIGSVVDKIVIRYAYIHLANGATPLLKSVIQLA